MVFASNLGFPRIGQKRQLKTALEKYWSGKIDEQALVAAGKELRLANWRFQRDAGIDFIPSNDFSFYDHVLDTAAMVGAVPERFGWDGESIDLKTYFLMARGGFERPGIVKLEAPAMEMTKWFNTNYHFIVPEIDEHQEYKLAYRKVIDEYIEAKKAGIETRPVLLGPVSFLALAKGQSAAKRFATLPVLVEVYEQVLRELAKAGAGWVQMDEPCLSLDPIDGLQDALQFAYKRLSSVKISILLATYFSGLGDNLAGALQLPVQGIHLDLVNGTEDLDFALTHLPSEMLLSAGVIDGHNVWRCNLKERIGLLENIAEKIGPERLIIAPNCSLIHVPLDVEMEKGIDSSVRSLLAFAHQKVSEISVLTDALCCGLNEVEALVQANEAALSAHGNSSWRLNTEVESRLAQLSPQMFKRKMAFPERYKLQQKRFNLPILPTTTIGSFPQTKDIRQARQQFRAGELDAGAYERAMEAEIENSILIQEKLGLDVFVHGEPERTDMVEYFASQLDGMAVTKHGWVQSYGSRYVKPPIIFGAVSRPRPMTVRWASYAQSLSNRPVKGMLTGPVTILQWSFVRCDQPRDKTCSEIALAIRDEVSDLEAAGIGVIQIDEPAIREGLPLKRAQWDEYLQWSVKAFRLASCGVSDETQIHTHMCYSEFGDMVRSIADMDADVISIEAARSAMELLATLENIEYPNAIGPGVYDIHSPRVPSEAEMTELLTRALTAIPAERLWVNPDCGLKTRTWSEVEPALKALVDSAKRVRQSVALPV